MPKPNDLSRSLIAFEQNSTLIAVIEMSLSSWGVKGRAVSIRGQDTKVHFMPLSRERTCNIAFAGSIHGAWMFAKAL